ncbi:MAG: chloride channel protein [Thermoplasmata archaeon]
MTGAPSNPSGTTTVHRGVGQLGDFTTSDRRMVRIALLAIVVGVLGAFVAAALYDLIGFFTNLFYYGRISITVVPPANTWGVLSVLVPVAGGLIIGVMARFGSERIRGHGIPEAIEAILIDRSKVQPKLAVLKPVSSAISIGTGGPFGAEGPIIMTGGAVGSVFGQFLDLTAVERKTLLVAGAAAGMAAIFNTPVAAVLLSVELLLFEWRPRSLVPVGVAAVTATFLSWYIIPAHGFGPLFPIPVTSVPTGPILLGAVLVGLLAAALATVLTWAVYFFEDSFRKLPIHWMWWPAIGGVVVGIGGLLVVESLGVGYGGICVLLGCTNTQLTALYPAVQITLVFVATLLVVKAIIWAVALGSGTSGGVLAPLLIIGGSLGVIEAHFLPFGSVPLWALVSMSATLGGTMRSPFTGVVFALELTHDVNALVPLLVAGIVADGFTVLSMKRSILTEKVARRGVHVAREYGVDVMERVPVRAVMHTGLIEAPGALSIEDLDGMAHDAEDPNVGYTLVGEDGRWAGFVTRSEVREYLRRGGDPRRPSSSLAREPGVVAFPDEPVRVAAARLVTEDARLLPVVDPTEPDRLVGFVTREDIFEAWALWERDQQVREQIFQFPDLSIFGRLRTYWSRKNTNPGAGTPTGAEVPPDRPEGTTPPPPTPP